jgi:hypothetical protein
MRQRLHTWSPLLALQEIALPQVVLRLGAFPFVPDFLSVGACVLCLFLISEIDWTARRGPKESKNEKEQSITGDRVAACHYNVGIRR